MNRDHFVDYEAGDLAIDPHTDAVIPTEADMAFALASHPELAQRAHYDNDAEAKLYRHAQTHAMVRVDAALDQLELGSNN